MPIKVLNEFLPNAEETRLGAIKVGDTLEIDQEEGVLNVDPTSVIGLYYSNCITEIAQDVKLEITGDNFVLKTGSRVYIPAGNNNTFSLYTAEEDLTINGASLNGRFFLCFYTDGSNIVVRPESIDSKSGDTFPENPTNATKFYKSDENLMYRYDGDREVWKPVDISIPLAIVTFIDGVAEDIIQIFNGASYFGHHVFILPDLKGVAPDGITERGYVKSINIEVDDIKIYDLTSGSVTDFNNSFLFINPSLEVACQSYNTVDRAKELVRATDLIQYSYNENKDYAWTGTTYINPINLPVVECSLKDSAVTYFRILQPLRIATVSDVKESTDSFLFDYKWADHIPNKLSWLRADTFSWQDGNIYTAAYKHLADDYNNAGVEASTSDTIGGVTVWYRLCADGHKICPPDQETNVLNIYNATGISWYYILDQVNHKFKLPRTAFGFTGIRDGVGRYVAPGVPNITGSFSAGGGCIYSWTNSSGALSASYSGSGNINLSGDLQQRDLNVNIDASRSSSIYGNSTTVQPPATQMYLYCYVGRADQDALEKGEINIEVLTEKSLSQINNTKDAGIDAVDAETEEGIHRIITASNALNQTQITNCILEIRQDIKLELNSGTVTLKAGSKVWYPDGFESDGITPKFSYYTLDTDRMAASSTSATYTDVIVINLYDESGTYMFWGEMVDTYSGPTTPTLTGRRQYWYDTTNNIIKYYNPSTTTWYTEHSGHKFIFPIGLFSVTGETGFTGINQVFNGFGYIGSTVFALPGVKGLIPNGKNANGTLNNISFERTTVNTYTFGGNYTGTMVLGLDNNNGFNGDTVRFVEQASKPVGNNWTWLNTNTNTLLSNYWNGSSYSDAQLQCCMFMSGYRTNDKIDWIKFKLPFHTLDYHTLASVTAPYLLDLGITSGTLALTTNTTYKLVGNGTITFTLPTTPTLGMVNTIRILYYQAAARTITWGTDYFYNGNVPDMTAAGYYDIYFDYNPILGKWVCGALTQEIA